MPQVIGVQVYGLRVELSSSFRIAYSSSAEATVLRVEILLSDGATGVGEAPPAPRVTGESLEAARAYIEEAAARLRGLRLPEEHGKALRAIHSAAPWFPAARMGLESALLAATAAHLGVEEQLLLGGDSSPARLLTDYTVSIPPPRVLEEIRATGYSAALAAAVEYIAGLHSEPPSEALEAGIPLPGVNGFHALKVKLGTGDPGLDTLLALAVAEAAPRVEIRVDANQAWSPKTAARVVRRLEEALGDRLRLVEQPVPADTPAEKISWLRGAIETPLALDESIRTPRELHHYASHRALDIVNIKLAKTGGPLQAAKLAAAAEAQGVEVMWGCMLETGAGIAHAAAAAAATGWIGIVDLDSPLFLREDPGAEWLSYRRTGSGVELEATTPHKEREEEDTGPRS